MTVPTAPLRAFAGYGIEIEYMIVARDGLDVLPVADELLKAVAGDYVNETAQGDIAWSNELALHVIELKTNGPAPALAPLPAAFHESVGRINALLGALGGRLMPTAAHPWMDPLTQTRLWPHGYDVIYAAYDRIFGCQGHGWSNLQSVHVNLPFADDAQFARLHAAIRLVLPLLPALAASSPFLDAGATGLMDSRMEAYRHNSARIPEIAGLIVPEPVRSRAEYQRDILAPMYSAIAPWDPDGILQEEWLNSRGAIARFDRNAIEIRVLDVQECPLADIAIAAAAAAVVRALYDGRGASLEAQLAVPTEALAAVLGKTVRDAERAAIDDAALLDAFAFPRTEATTAGALWAWLTREFAPVADPALAAALEAIHAHGPLSRRLLRATGQHVERATLEPVYRTLCDCLADNRMFGV